MAQMGGSSGPAWLSTHPASADRAQKLREMIPVLIEEEKGWKPTPKPGNETPTKSVTPGAVRK
jgi:predicted Zn-dependent protease